MANMIGRVSYLRGLCDGLDLQPDTKESKVLLAMIDVLDEMAAQVASLEEAHQELDEYVESIDDDLSNMEESLFGDEGPGMHSHFHPADYGFGEEEEEDIVEFECPHCGYSIISNAYEFDLESEHTCPRCGKSIVIEDIDSDED